MAMETRPFVVATPKRKFARKSAIPMKQSNGRDFAGNPPVVRNRIAKRAQTSTEATRIEVIVSNEFVFEPIAINVSAVPNPSAATQA